MPIHTFDRNGLRFLRAEIDAALKIVAEKHGISVVLGSARFTDRTATFKLELAVTDAVTGTAVNKEAEAFKRNAHFYGLKPEDLGREFAFGGKRFRIDGLLPRSTTYPILATKLSNGKQVKVSSEMVLTALGRPL